MFHVKQLFVNQSFFIDIHFLQNIKFVQEVFGDPFVVLIWRDRFFGVIDAPVFVIRGVNVIKIGSKVITAPSLDCGTNCPSRLRFGMNHGFVVGVESIAPTNADSERSVEF